LGLGRLASRQQIETSYRRNRHGDHHVETHTSHCYLLFLSEGFRSEGKTRESAEPNDRFPHLALVEAIARVLRQDLAYDDPNPTR
jgi:hypothetical protein